MPVSPADVIAGTLRRAGVPQADIHAKAIAADLAGHGLLYETNRRSGTKRSTEPPEPGRARRPAHQHRARRRTLPHMPVGAAHVGA